MVSSLLCLAAALYFESGSQSLKGKVAVANVILNRVEEGFRGETTICGVVKARSQFSFFSDGKSDEMPQKNRLEIKAWDESYLLASSILAEGSNGEHLADLTAGATHYHAYYVSPCWTNENYFIKIDDHLFLPEVVMCKKPA